LIIVVVIDDEVMGLLVKILSADFRCSKGRSVGIASGGTALEHCALCVVVTVGVEGRLTRGLVDGAAVYG